MLIESDRIVVAGRRCFVFVRRALKKDAECARAITPRGGYAGGQTIARGGADYENVARSAFAAGWHLLGHSNLPFDIQLAAFRMRVDADKAAGAALDDLTGHVDETDTLQREQAVVQRRRKLKCEEAN
jgi:hypothetical protein